MTAGRDPVVTPLCLKKTALRAGRVPVNSEGGSTGIGAEWIRVDRLNRAGTLSTVPLTSASTKMNEPGRPGTDGVGPATTVAVPVPVLHKTSNSFPFFTGRPGATDSAKIETAAGGKLGY